MSDDLHMELFLDTSDSNSNSSDDEFEIMAIVALQEELLNVERVSKRRRGSIQGHATKHRDRIEGHNRLYKDYFAENPVYSPIDFRRRFRMRRSLFLRIVEFVEAHDLYFVQKRNAAGVLGLSSLQKVTAAMRMLAYGLAADAVDDYVRIGESTAIVSLKRFVKVVIEFFRDEYLRSPNNADIDRLLAEGERRGFPGMLGSIDCMHWKWKNCPVAWKGMYVHGDIHDPSIILEAVASYDLWIWHAFFGLPGSHNDINVLERSHLFANLAEGRAPTANYSINGHNYTTGYYLADGIYPPWSTFVKTIPHPQENKHKNFATAQESIRKDVEQAFGVLQAHFAIVRGPSRFWDPATLKDIMIACIIMHNMIVEDERGVHMPNNNYEVFEESVDLSHDPTVDFVQFLQNHQRIRNREAHSQLQADLIEHLWQYQGTQ